MSDARVEWAVLWRVTRAKIAAGSLTREGWIQHLRAEADLAKRDDNISLEAILVVGLKHRFIGSVEDAAALLGT